MSQIRIPPLMTAKYVSHRCSHFVLIFSNKISQFLFMQHPKYILYSMVSLLLTWLVDLFKFSKLETGVATGFFSVSRIAQKNELCNILRQ